MKRSSENGALKLILIILSPILAPMIAAVVFAGVSIFSMVPGLAVLMLLVETYTNFPFWTATGYTIMAVAIVGICSLVCLVAWGVVNAVFEDHDGFFWFIGIGFWVVFFLAQLHPAS